MPDKEIMTRLSESAVLASEILGKRPAIPDTREQERLEAFQAVLSEMRPDDPVPDRLAACCYLIQHLCPSPSTVS